MSGVSNKFSKTVLNSSTSKYAYEQRRLRFGGAIANKELSCCTSL
ncbi:hypothetical protein [Nostoc sp. FACHB-280]|nr:hypothetical protein [Nostoc sp. FACHB-280]